MQFQASRVTVNTDTVERVRKVALFEGKDEFGRLQPLLGIAEPATNFMGETRSTGRKRPCINKQCYLMGRNDHL
jgi:hypothetical protein